MGRQPEGSKFQGQSRRSLASHGPCWRAWAKLTDACAANVRSRCVGHGGPFGITPWESFTEPYNIESLSLTNAAELRVTGKGATEGNSSLAKVWSAFRFLRGAEQPPSPWLPGQLFFPPSIAARGKPRRPACFTGA